MIFSVKSTLPVFAFASLNQACSCKALDTRGRGGETSSSKSVKEQRPNGQTLNILWWLYKKNTWSYSCYRINWYPYHIPTVLREKSWDTRLAFSENTAYHPFYFQISKVRFRKTWTDDSNVIFIPSSPMMNNDYKNIICGCRVWSTQPRLLEHAVVTKKKIVFLTPPPPSFLRIIPSTVMLA